MPRGDGTGPMGMGPMTGRAAGYCAGFPTPGFMNPMGGRLGLGLGRGRAFWPYGYYGAARFPSLPYAPYPMYGSSGTMPYSFPQAPGITPGAAPFAPGVDPEQELSFLRSQVSTLKSQIDQTNSRIKELEKMEK
jgi:hypothetical protein